MTTDLPLRVDEALVVAGSENWNSADRHLGRDNVRALQMMTVDGPRHLAQFESVGALGVRDLVVLDDGERAVLSTGYELFELTLGDGRLRPWSVGDGTSDLHEVSIRERRVLVANTAYDEILEFDEGGALAHRHEIARFRAPGARRINHARPLGGVVPIGPKPVRDDHFHLNQCEVAPDGQLLVVVHHVSGFRPMTHLRHRLTGHGDGGVLELDTGEVHPLGLRAPHSLRPLPDGGWIILDSGRGEAVIYDGRWRQRRRFATPGWGRGLAVADDGRVFVGVSATRARYLEPDEDPGANRVVAFDLDGRELGRWELPDVEQVWSVRLLSRVQGDALASCSAERAPA